MADVATPEFLSQMKSLYPEKPAGELSPWSFIVAAAFSASNMPEAVPLVYMYASEGLSTDEERLALLRRMKDAVFKSGMLSGYPKAINALGQLHAIVPSNLRDAAPLRDVSMTTKDLNRVGQDLFDRTYGDTGPTVQSFLRDIYPDLEHFSTTFAYGYTYGFSDVLTAAETSFAMVAALIAADTPRQIDWHLHGAIRNGASRAEIEAVRRISIEVSRAAGVVWKNDIPDV